MNILDIVDKYDKPIFDLDKDKQAEEIDRRLHDLYIYRTSEGKIATKADMAAVLKIDTDTFAHWVKIETPNRIPIDESSKSYNLYKARAAILKKWITISQAEACSLTQDARSPASNLFLLKSVYGYHEYEQEKKQLDVVIKYDDLLQGVKDYEQQHKV